MHKAFSGTKGSSRPDVEELEQLPASTYAPRQRVSNAAALPAVKEDAPPTDEYGDPVAQQNDPEDELADIYGEADDDAIAAFFNEFREETVKKKDIKRVIRRVSGADQLDALRFGPDFIDEDWYECTPMPLWQRADQLLDIEALLHKSPQDVLDWTPMVPATFSAYWEWTQNREGALSFDPSLSSMEEDEFVQQFEQNFPSEKLAYMLQKKTKKDWYKQIKVCDVAGNKCVTKDVLQFELTESKTYMDLEIRGNLVYENDVKNFIHGRERNEQYWKIVKHHFEADAYSPDYAQTYDLYTKDNFTSYKIRGCADIGIDTHFFHIDDEYEAIEEAERQRRIQAEEDEEMRLVVERAQRELAAIRSWHGSSSSDDSSDIEEPLYISTCDWEDYKDSDESSDYASDSEYEIESEDDLFNILSSEDEFDTELPLKAIYNRKEEIQRNSAPVDKDYPNISSSTCILERMVGMKTHQGRHADLRQYTNFPKWFEGFSESQKPRRFKRNDDRKDDLSIMPQLVRFWSFKHDRCEGQEVTSIIIHPLNGEMIAAAYGSCNYGERSPGTVCIWSTKNISFPERFYKLPSPCTAVSFAQLCPYLLAVGMLDGSIAIFDIRTDDCNSVISTMYQDDKHQGPVWHIYWLVETQVTFCEIITETLLTVGDDGYLKRWSLLKGIESMPMLKFRRSPLKPPGRRENRAEALLSSLSAGYTVTFFPKEPEIFLLGTEEGFIHKCTTAHNEQYVGTYIGHTGPVYHVVFSKFDLDCFCSCSGDHTMKIWKTDYFLPLVNMQTGLRTVYDCATIPTMSTGFICATEFHIEIWDLTLNTLEPVVNYKPPYSVGIRKAVYNEYLNGIIVGDDTGTITVYGLRDFPVQPTDPVEQLDQLMEGLFPGYRRRLREAERMAVEAEEMERLRQEREEREKDNESKNGANKGPPARSAPAQVFSRGIDRNSPTAVILAATAKAAKSLSGDENERRSNNY